MTALDFALIALYLLGSLAVGLRTRERASVSAVEYFLAGRSLPWWAAGTSMVATTFAADTPLAVTGLVASGGVAGNWIWWVWGVAHVLAALVFARYWRRLEVLTDAEVLERRYSGRPAAVLRAAKAAYMALFLNTLTLGWVILAMRKISGAILPGVDPALATYAAMALAVGYSALGGLRSVVLTDLFQFGLAMLGALALCGTALHEQGGLEGMVAALHQIYGEKTDSILAFVPQGDLPGLPLTLFAVLLTVGWWRVAEGGGYLAQRFAACRDAQQAERAGLLFAVVHNAVRPWPWILVGLCALVVWPLDAGPCVELCPTDYQCVEGRCVVPDREATYVLMMQRTLPPGLLGLMVTSLLAAFMSTVDTHVNWGSSYLVRDVWERFLRPQASAAEQVRVGRIAAVGMGALAATLSLGMESISGAWLFILTLGSGLGSATLARWLWWRVNATAELVSLGVSTALALGVVLAAAPSLWGWSNPLYLGPISQQARLLIVSLGSLACWLPVAWWGPADPMDRMVAFYRGARPPRWGWRPVAEAAGEDFAEDRGLPLRLAAGFLAVFGGLFGLGGWLLREPTAPWAALTLLSAGAFGWLLRGSAAE